MEGFKHTGHLQIPSGAAILAALCKELLLGPMSDASEVGVLGSQSFTFVTWQNQVGSVLITSANGDDT